MSTAPVERVIKVRPLGQLHMGLRNLSGVDAFAIDKASTAPLPSTVLGAVGYMLGVVVNTSTSHVNYDFDDLRQLARGIAGVDLAFTTSTREPILWGPLVNFNGGGYGGYYIPIDNKLLSISNVKRYIDATIKYYEDPFGEEAKELGKLLINYAKSSGRVGIELARESKTVRRMFKVTYTSYKPEPECGGGETTYPELDFTYVLRLSKANEGWVADVVRLGGEGRLALFSLGEAFKPPTEGDFAIALQPILIHADRPIAEISGVAGLECVEEVYGVLSGDEFKVRVIDLGLGFSEVGRFRRPMLKALPQGTVIRLRNSDECRGALAVGLLSELGYGSLYRVALS